MQTPMSRMRSVDTHQFSMIPRADVPRSVFNMETAHKTTFSASNLIPIYLQEILPGDTFNVSMAAMIRLATPIYPIMDNMHLESWFFFVPNRLSWSNWVKMMGEQDNPGDSISYTVPQIVSPAGGFPRLGIYDYLGLPCTPNLGANTISINALPLRAYNRIWNEWFRDENLDNAISEVVTDGPDTSTNYVIQKTRKRHDYFTSALPWTQKGVSPPLFVAGNALVKTSATETFTGVQTSMKVRDASTGAQPVTGYLAGIGASNAFDRHVGVATFSASGAGLYPTNLYADLSTATSNTINALRLAFQTQRLLERDARGGTRYTELVRSHFGVSSPDARLQRPEYLGGGVSPVNITPIAQQTQTGLTGGSTPLGTLGAVGTVILSDHGYSGAFNEHGFVLGLVAVRADLSYQQGVRKLWSRSTRYDHYFPAFAMLGEQAILNKEIYCDGSANDLLTFGYQERWSEMRYHPSMVTGYFNSTNATPLDAWHLSEKFTSLPALNATFIADPAINTVKRAVAVGAAADNQQFIGDFFFKQRAARPMPMYSVPGLIDHF